MSCTIIKIRIIGRSQRSALDLINVQLFTCKTSNHGFRMTSSSCRSFVGPKIFLFFKSENWILKQKPPKSGPFYFVKRRQFAAALYVSTHSQWHSMTWLLSNPIIFVVSIFLLFPEFYSMTNYDTFLIIIFVVIWFQCKSFFHLSSQNNASDVHLTNCRAPFFNRTLHKFYDIHIEYHFFNPFEMGYFLKGLLFIPF